ncbi:MAG: hypothetical protein ACI9HK_003706 [Pirellulaceae bacterium]|jgi:hypothetical protein
MDSKPPENLASIESANTLSFFLLLCGALRPLRLVPNTNSRDVWTFVFKRGERGECRGGARIIELAD